jgi:hypothetical protein
MGMTESMWSFLRRNALLILSLLAIPSACSFMWPLAPIWLSLSWSTLLPAVLVAWIGHREASLAKAHHNVILDAISERLAKGRLTERERELVLTFYEELRHKLHDGAIRRGSFHPGECLQLVLMKARRDGAGELLQILSRLHAAPEAVPQLTSDEEGFLAKLAASDSRHAKVIVQWLFVSDGALAIERLQEGGDCAIAADKISEYILDLARTLPAQSEKYSRAVGFLSVRKEHLKGKTDFLRELQERLFECDGRDFEDTVAVIGGINSEEGLRTLSECYGDLRGEKKKCVSQMISGLRTALASC